MKTRQRLAVAVLALALVATALWLTRSEPLPPGVTPEVAGLVRTLRAKPGVHQRFATRLALKIHPRVLNWLPGLLREDLMTARSLDACHALIARGAEVRPAVPLVLEAFRDPDSTVSFYAFVVVVYSGLPAAEFARLARQPPASPVGPVHFYAGLLATEDERLREYAWACLEASGSAALAVAPRLQDLASEGDPALRKRAATLLNKWKPRSAENSSGDSRNTPWQP